MVGGWVMVVCSRGHNKCIYHHISLFTGVGGTTTLYIYIYIYNIECAHSKLKNWVVIVDVHSINEI